MTDADPLREFARRAQNAQADVDRIISMTERVTQYSGLTHEQLTALMQAHEPIGYQHVEGCTCGVDLADIQAYADHLSHDVVLPLIRDHLAQDDD